MKAVVAAAAGDARRRLRILGTARSFTRPSRHPQHSGDRIPEVPDPSRRIAGGQLAEQARIAADGPFSWLAFCMACLGIVPRRRSQCDGGRRLLSLLSRRAGHGGFSSAGQRDEYRSHLAGPGPASIRGLPGRPAESNLKLVAGTHLHGSTGGGGLWPEPCCCCTPGKKHLWRWFPGYCSLPR